MTSTRTVSIVPADFAELFRYYYPYVVKLVRTFSIEESDVEDVAMIILTKFMEKDVLSDYDPDYRSVEGKPAGFMTFLSGFVASYVRHYVSRQRVHQARHPFSVDRTLLLRDSPSSWIEVYGPKHYDDLSHVTDAQFLSAVRSRLSTLPVVGRRDMALLFELIIDQLDERGRIHKEELAGLFGVSPASIHQWIKLLSVHVSEAVA